MSNPEDVRVEIVYQQESTESDDEQRLLAAQLKTRQLLEAWRSRFTGTAVTATYDAHPEAQIVVHSAAPDQVRVEQTVANGKIMYDYDDTRPGVKLQITAEPSEHAETALTVADDPALQHEALSQILFDCERTEFRKDQA